MKSSMENEMRSLIARSNKQGFAVLIPATSIKAIALPDESHTRRTSR